MKRVMGRYMVKSPFVIEPDASVNEARQMMTELGIRHLPVIAEDGELRGLVSERDLSSAKAQEKNAKIADFMRTEVYTVEPDANLAEVVGVMADEKMGSALVVSPGNDVLGIFTTVDALRLLADLLDDEEENLSLDDYFEDWRDYATA